METITKEASVKEVLNVIKSTPEEIIIKGGDYNMSEWRKRINNLVLRSSDVQFYIAPPQRGYDYERYFATYKIEEGIIFFNQFSPASSSISSNGFCRITICPSTGVVRRHLLKDTTGNEGRCENDKVNRKIMAGNSHKFGAIFSNNY